MLVGEETKIIGGGGAANFSCHCGNTNLKLTRIKIFGSGVRTRVSKKYSFLEHIKPPH